MFHVSAAVTLRQQHLDGLAAQFDAVVTEEFLGLAVGQHDAARVVHNHNGVGRGFQQVAVAGLDQFGVPEHLEMRHVLLVGDETFELSLIIADGPR